jgi:hypothetical protein
MKKDKTDFIKKEIWFLTVSSAFQRANIYKSEVNDDDKKKFKKDLFNFIDKIAKGYLLGVDESNHLDNIKKISMAFVPHKQILQEGQLNFGVSQKLLNLYLKYLWCLEKIKLPPPHFPVDRKIQEKFRMNEVKSWTRMEGEVGESDYLKIIQKAKDYMLECKFNSIAELELFLFSYDGNINDLEKAFNGKLTTKTEQNED